MNLTAKRIAALAALFLVAVLSLLTGDSGAFTAALAKANDQGDGGE